MPHPLKPNGDTPADPRLGRIPQQDLRSLNFLITDRIRKAATVPRRPRSFTWSIDVWLDQGQEGACVGFGFSHDLAARPQMVVGVTDRYAFDLYYAIQMEDPWPGGAYPGADPRYDGTSVLTGAKVATDLGFYDGYDWALTAFEVAEGIAYDGPCILGLNWHPGMFDPDAKGFLRPTGAVAGGHCIMAHAVKIVYKPRPWIYWWKTRTWDDVDIDRSYIVVHNSWGKSWGLLGKAYISLRDLETLMQAGGEACFPSRTGRIFVG